MNTPPWGPKRLQQRAKAASKEAGGVNAAGVFDYDYYPHEGIPSVLAST